MNTVGKLRRWLLDSGLGDDVPIAVQAYGKAAKHYAWTVELFAGEVVICVNLARKRRICPVCNGTEFDGPIDDEAFTDCVTCARLGDA